MERITGETVAQSNDAVQPHEGGSWSNPGNFPDFVGDKVAPNVEKLQSLLNRTGFSELRKDSDRFNQFLEQADRSDLYRYLQRVNQSLREATVAERGFHDGRMFVGGMISPNRNTQLEVLDDTIDAISKMPDDKYRAALAYYQINSLHIFPDANGRTSRAVYIMLRRPDFDLKANADFITHANNRSQGDSGGKKTSEFEKMNGLMSPQEFTQYSMLELLKSMQGENSELGEELEPISQTMEYLLSQDPRRRANIVTIVGAETGAEAGDTLYALRNNSAYRELNDGDRQRFNYALCDNNSLVSIAGLAMLKFHREKGDLRQFLETNVKSNPALGGLSQCIINIDPEEREIFGRCECENWSTDDMMRYTAIAEDLKKNQLEMGIDIFANPDLHEVSSGEKVAEILAR